MQLPIDMIHTFQGKKVLHITIYRYGNPKKGILCKVFLLILTCVPPLCTGLFERQTSRRRAACRSWKKGGINPPKKCLGGKIGSGGWLLRTQKVTAAK
jgi:hypothetical protein